MDANTLERVFESLGIDYGRPGFFDHPKFIEAESADPTFLEKYAEYVHLRPYAEGYLLHAREVIRRMAVYIHSEIRADGRKGACIDASMAFSRMLDRDGIWNCVVKGATRVDFPASLGLEAKRFEHFIHASKDVKAGHVWLCAPPYRVVDVTIDLQPYEDGEEKLIHGPALDESPRQAQFGVEDLVDLEVRKEFFVDSGRALRMSDVEGFAPGVIAGISKFGCFEVLQEEVNITYVACGSGASEESLEELRSLVLRGKYPSALYEEFKRICP